jgi:hypothetical protein
MAFADLTAEQQQAFRDRLALAGIDPGDVVKHVGPSTHPGQLIASSDPDESTIKPYQLTVEDVDTLKRLAGNPDEHYEQGLMEERHTVPEPWPEDRSDLRPEDATPEDRERIHHAHVVWLYGNSKHVQSYRDVINNMEYPKEIPVFVAEVVDVTKANSPYVIKPAESGHVYGVVTIYDGGSIQFEGDVDFNCQKMVKSDLSGPPSERER